MKFLVETVVDYIKKEFSSDKGKLVYVMPSYPSEVLLEIGNNLKEYFSRLPEKNISFKYEIAYKLGQQWLNGTELQKSNFETIQSKGWYNKNDNLTELRNTQRDSEIDNLVVIMAGYEHINDRESLRDFFHLDQQSIWSICLNRSFRGWLEKRLEPHINLGDSKEDIEKINVIFKTLYDYGLADLTRISTYLEENLLSDVQDGNDAYKNVLDNLETFKLPCLIGLSTRYAKNKSFAYYLEHALNFFSYSMFLDSTARQKALNRVEYFKEAANKNEIEYPDKEHLGDYVDIDDLIESLKWYINNRSEDARESLKAADFVYVFDEIIGFKKVSTITPPTPRKPKKLIGLPLEVFLRAIWLTLGDFKDNLKSSSIFIGEDLKGITIKSINFKHDEFDNDEDDEELTESEKAERFLIRAIGGIDQLLEESLNIQLDTENHIKDIEFKSYLSPKENRDFLKYQKTYTAEPCLKFEVYIHSDNKSLKREFLWALPQNHQCRIIANLFDWVKSRYRGNALPAFGFPYLAELFSASEEDEANRILTTALQGDCHFIDLLKAPGINEQDNIKTLLINLSFAYQEFLEVFDSGFFNALESPYENLRVRFNEMYSTFLENISSSELAPLLYKAFLIVSSEETAQTDWCWRDNIKGAIVTPLHPALLEMVRHQHTFLCESFCTYVQEALTQPKNKMLTEKSWSRVVDLATLVRPIYGVLEKNQILNTNTKSFSYMHLFGDYKGESSFIGSRLLLEYDDFDEDITDAELFAETRSSRLVKQTLMDYKELYPFAEDGISVGGFCGKDIQAIIAGIDTYLKQYLEASPNREYTLALTIFSDNRDDSAVMRWVNAWKDRWQVVELSNQRSYYSNCKISINYRVVSSFENYSQFKVLLSNIDFDVMFFTDFIKSDESRFALLDGYHKELDDYRKFPVLEKTCPRITGGGRDQQRERILSNQRFRIGWLHAEVMAHLKSGSTTDRYHAVISKSDYKPWKSVIDTAHKQCTWVICIDPAIDDQLLYVDENIREIIGLGTGVGPHGENNYTISTEQFVMADIETKISELIGSLFDNLTQRERDKITDSLVKQALQIAGLSIVKATGPIRFVRELVANVMVRKLVKKGVESFCDEIISLDAFLHWFNDSERRPDLLRVQARIVDGYFDIEAQIIECKLAMYGEGFLEDAREQIESGIRQLVQNFRPRGLSPSGIGDKPDQRYWWMQLHRLISSKGETDKSNYQDAMLALERLSEGFFNIKWQAAAVAFWTDIDSDSIELNEEWLFNFDGQDLSIAVATAGKHVIKEVCLNKISTVILNQSALSYKYPGSGNDGSGNETPTDEIEKPKVEEKREPDTKKDETGEKNGKLLVKQLPERILLGSHAPGRDLYWEFGHTNLPNRHILVFGASGTGKTYTIQALLYEIGKLGQNSIIVDYTNGFTNKQLENVIIEKLKPHQHYIRNEPLQINPFRQQLDFIDDMEFVEKPTNTADRVTGVFVEVYQLGDQQKSALYSSIRSGIIKEGNKFNLISLIRELEAIQAVGGPKASPAASVISKINPFVDMNPFGEEDPESWERIYNDSVSKCHIIQLAGFPKDTARLITEFTLIDLYWYYRAKGSKDDPKIIVLDEIQNLDHRLDSPIGQFLTEGRKFGISLILATQTLSNLGKDERDRLFQASHKLFFKPADTEVRTFAQILSDATGLKSEQWVERLTSLKRGECYSLGNTYNEQTKKLEVGKSFKIKIKSLEERV